MFDIDKSINKMLGKTKSKKNDFDGDGVPNWKDCQPRNTMRQDEIKEVEDFDRDVQRFKILKLDDELRYIWDNSKGNGWGWGGIAKEDPEQFKKALELARQYR